MAVFFAPWIDRDTALRRIVAAEGILVRNGGFPWIVIAKSDDPAFAWRLYRAGAWLVGNPLADGGCAVDVGNQP